MTPLRTLLLARAALSPHTPCENFAERQAESARLMPLLTALIEVAEAAEQIQNEISRARETDCLGCCNGNDIPDEELCRACWKVWVKGKCYPLWDIDATEKRLETLKRLREMGEGK